MAKYFTGIDGELRFNGKRVAKVASWSFNAQTSTLETTTLGDYAREYVGGIQSYSGSASIYYYTDNNGALEGSDLLKEVIRVGPPDLAPAYEMVLRVQRQPLRQVKLKVVITSAELTAAPGELIAAQISFVGTEPLIDASIAA